MKGIEWPSPPYPNVLAVSLFFILLLNNKLDAALVKMNRPAQETDFLQEKLFFKKCIVTQLLVTKVSVNMLIVSSLPVFNLLSHTLVLISSANKT